MNKGDKATAEAKFQEAVQKNPDLPAGWNALAILAYEKKDWAKTLEYGEKALDLDPIADEPLPDARRRREAERRQEGRGRVDRRSTPKPTPIRPRSCTTRASTPTTRAR